jgi:AcrR family transcriptional regulator
MSGSDRQRLTRVEQREQTVTRLLDSAEELFARNGIAETSIEEIAENAGYSRGAFYSNFDDKDSIVLRLIDREQQRGIAETNAIVESASDGDELLDRLLEWSRNLGDPRTTIGIEYVLYASRNPKLRPRMKELSDRLLAQHAHLVRSQHALLDVEMPITPEDGAKIMLALDEGYALLRLNDPDAYPRSLWSETIAFLNEAVVALAEKRANER